MEAVEMSERHKKKLLKHRVYIIRLMCDIEDVVELLYARGCLVSDQAQRIQAQATPNDRTRLLLTVLPKLADKAYYVFLDALEETQECPDLYNQLKDDDMAEVVRGKKGCVLYGLAQNYYIDLKAFHLKNLQELEKRSLHDPFKSYMNLTLYPQEMKENLTRKGFRELNLDMIKVLGKPIVPEVLFGASAETKDEETRTVLMLGGPGVGKTVTAYHFLLEHTKGRMWNEEFSFIIFILFREINHFKITLCFRDLLFNCFGPPLSDEKAQQRVWKYILRHQNKLLFILDGFDEAVGLGTSVNPSFTIPFYDTSTDTNIQILLHNLIQGHILPDSRILLTSRPHCAQQLQNVVDKTVELGGFDEKHLEMLMEKKFESNPQLVSSVKAYLRSNPNILSLCSSPVNALGLLNYIEWQCNETEKFESTSLPRTRAALLFLLTVNLLHKHSRSCQCDHGLLVTEILEIHREVLLKCTKLAYNELSESKTAQQLFEAEKLLRYGLKVEQVTTSGLMIGHVSSMADLFGKVKKTLLGFPHLTFQEQFAALGVKKDDNKALHDMVEINDGERDMVIQLHLGQLGDPLCQPLLQCLYPDIDPDTYGSHLEQLLSVIWSSPRRFQSDGALFCISCLAESLQYQLCDRLVEQLVTPLNTLYLWDTPINPSDSVPLAQFLSHVRKPFTWIGISDGSGKNGVHAILNAGGITGVTLVARFDAEMLEILSQALHKSPHLKSIILEGHQKVALTPEDWTHFKITPNCDLQLIALLRGMIKGTESFGQLCEHLQVLTTLETFYLHETILQNPEDILPLLKLKAIRYLKLWACGLGPQHMDAVCQLVLQNGIVYLDVSDNPITDQGAHTLAECMQNPNNKLVGLRIANCKIHPDGLNAIFESIINHRTFKSLNINSNYGKDAVHALIKCVKDEDCGLQELYAYKCNLYESFLVELVQSLQYNTTLSMLNISSNDITDQVMTQLADALRENHTLKALSIILSGTVTDSMMEKLTSALEFNTTVELLDISGNPRLTLSTIVNLLTRTKLKHLAAYNYHLSANDWENIGKALVGNHHICSCVLGEDTAKDALSQFLEQMCSYPKDGPLEHLMLRGQSFHLAQHLSVLKRTIGDHVNINFVTFALPFYALSGVWQAALPADVMSWLMGAHTTIK